MDNNMNGQQYDGTANYNNGQQYDGTANYSNGQQYDGAANYNNGQQYGGAANYNNGQQYVGVPNYNNGQQYGGTPNYNNGQQYGGVPNYNNGQQYGGAQGYNNGQPYGVMPEQNMYGQPGYSGTPETPKKSRKGLMIGLVIGGVVALAIAIVLILVFVLNIFGKKCKSPEEVAIQFTKAVQDKDEDLIVDLMSKEYRDYVIEEYDYKNIKEVKEDLAESLVDDFYDEMEDYYDLGTVKSITYDEDDIKVDKYSGSDLDLMKGLFKEYMGCEIDGYAEIEMEWTVRGSEDKDTISVYIDAYKIDDVWYWFTFNFY